MLRRNIKKEAIMTPLDIAAIEHQARRLRAAEMQRIHGLMSAHLSVYRDLLLSTLKSGLIAIGKTLRPLFSWNPQARHPS